MRDFFHGSLGSTGLRGTNCSDGGEHGRVNSTRVEEEHAENFLDMFGVSGIDEDVVFVMRCILDLGAVVGFLPSVWGIFGLCRSTMSKALERTVNIAWQGNVTGACVVVPFEREIECSVCEEGVKNPDAIAFDHLNRKTIENLFGYSQSEYLSITCKELDRYPLSVFLDSGLWQELQDSGLVEALKLDPQSDDYMCQVSAALLDPLVSESCCGTAKDPEEICGMCEDGKTIRDPGLILGDGYHTCEFLDWSVAAAHGLWQVDEGETDCEYFKRTVPSTTPELSFAEALRIVGRECGCSNQKSSATRLVASSSTVSIIFLFVATILLGA
jgi:hypothetical protein